jgi:hypothetical protein
VSELSRRRFIGLGLATAVGAVLGGPVGQLTGVAPSSIAGASPAEAGFAAPAEAGFAAPAEAATWQRWIGESFVATSANGRHLALILRSATSLRPDPLLRGEGCSMIFSGALQPLVPSWFSVLSHPELGRVTVTLLPVNRPIAHQWYQLIVDRRTLVETNRR